MLVVLRISPEVNPRQVGDLGLSDRNPGLRDVIIASTGHLQVMFYNSCAEAKGSQQIKKDFLARVKRHLADKLYPCQEIFLC